MMMAACSGGRQMDSLDKSTNSGLIPFNTHRNTNMPKTSDMIESKYLKKEDVGEDGVIVTVESLEQVNVAQKGEAPEYRWTIKFREFEKPMVMNSTNIKLAEKALASDDTDDWVGKKLVAYNDPNVSFGKEIVGGIRLKAHRKSSGPREVPARHVDDLDGDPPF